MDLELRKSRKEDFEDIRSDLAMGEYVKRIGKGCQNLGVGVDPRGGKIEKVILAPQGLPVAFVHISSLSRAGRDFLGSVLTNKTTKKIANDWIILYPSLLKEGLNVGGDLFDVKIASQVRNAGVKVRDFSLESLIYCYLDQTLSSDPLIRSAQEVSALIFLEKILTIRLKKMNLMETAGIEFACIPAVVQMHSFGLGVDHSKIEIIEKVLVEKTGQARKDLLLLLGKKVNVDSPEQLLAALNASAVIQKGGLNIESTQKKTLRAYVEGYPVIQAILSYRELKSKRDSVRTYIETINPETKRIHSTYDPMGTATGRFSCKKPAVQGLPKDKEIRSCFVPGPGRKFVIADYSQIELRIAAAISQDRKMIKAFQSGQDFHRLTASIISGIPFEKVSDSQRQSAKAINFGVLFGMGPEGLRDYAMSNYGHTMSIEDAERFQDAFFDAYPQLDTWCQKQKKRRLHWNEGDEVWETRTLCNRIRLWKDESPSGPELLNTPIQGTAADIIKIALARVVRAFVEIDATIVACVHDEIVVETNEDIAEEVSEMLEQIMEDAARVLLDPVPVKVDVDISDSWFVE